jgi:hypothetical protein
MKLDWKATSMFVAVGVSCFFAGSIINARPARANAVPAESGHVFELRIYHDLPGKLPVMESRFRDNTSKLLAKHNLNVLGYWKGEGRDENTFVFLLEHDNTDDAKKNWKALIDDPDFQQVEKAELSEKTLERAEVIHMRATEFSRLK